jgi:hypothetical protein
MPVGIDLRDNLPVELQRSLCPASVESISRSPLQALFEVEVLWTSAKNCSPECLGSTILAADLRFQAIDLKRFGLEAPPGFEPGMEVLQI